MRTPIVLLVLAACGAPAQRRAPAPTVQPAPSAAKSWTNPGGMWLPQQVPEQAPALRALGLEIDPAALADPTRDPLGAVVSLGGCSASFVSPDGLIATNHHCVQGALAYNATPESDLIENGYLARTRDEEKWAGPAATATVALKITDVTAEMSQGLFALPDDLARHDAVEEREKRLIAACEKDRPELRCDVKSFFGGGRWYLYEQLEIRDLRLVYAPPRSIGNFGGEVDNWMWPRQTGDFSFLRAWVGKDGKPAEHADGNIPYRPTHYLRAAKEPLREGDLILVAGFPGTTNRLATAYETDEAATWLLPRSLEVLKQRQEMLEKITAGNPDLRIKAEPTLRGVLNYLKKNGGVLKTLTEGGALAQRKEADRQLTAWIDADPTRAGRFKTALERLRDVQATMSKTREADQSWKDLIGGSKLLEQAIVIVRLASERAKPDAARKLAFQQRNWRRLERASQQMVKSYARPLDRAQLRLYLVRAIALPPDQRPPGLEKIVGKKLDEKAVDAALDRLYAGTKLEDGATRGELIRTATRATVAKSKDSFIRLAAALLPEIVAQERRAEGFEGALLALEPLYVSAMEEMRGKSFAPDANGTLRITFGTVQPPPSGGSAFTTVKELLAKNRGEKPFNAPEKLLEPARAAGDQVVDFMSDADITNGNSGSATLNARGEFVGLAFDGTLDTVASDWLYLEGKSRTIHVDLRYLAWVMRTVDHADNLLEEMGL